MASEQQFVYGGNGNINPYQQRPPAHYPVYV